MKNNDAAMQSVVVIEDSASQILTEGAIVIFDSNSVRVLALLHSLYLCNQTNEKKPFHRKVMCNHLPGKL